MNDLIPARLDERDPAPQRIRSPRPLSLALFCAAALLGSAAAGAADPPPWRLGDALGLPSWLDVAGSERLRFEFMDDTFRIADPGLDELLVSRLLLMAEVRRGRLHAGLELQDSRAWLHDSLTPLGTDDVNALEAVQAWLGVRDGNSGVRLGRFSMNIGSRRLVARNSFRNTTNAFAGAHVLWTRPGGITLDAFYTWPVIREPDVLERDRLRDNDVDFDDTVSDLRFYGAALGGVPVRPGLLGSLYVMKLEEADRSGLPTPDRDLLTAGLHLEQSSSTWSWTLEVAVQTGESRATPLPTDTRDLDHDAFFVHLSLTRSFDARWQPRLTLSYDHASGDDDPDDGDMGRFDTLFGARRFDFGPTGIYGALARSNVTSPGAGLDLGISERLTASIGYRAAWLASRRDVMATAGLRDPTGQSGSFVGQQLDFAFTVDAVPGNLVVELGGAVLFKGEFLKDAPNAPPPGNTLYGYLQATLSF